MIRKYFRKINRQLGFQNNTLHLAWFDEENNFGDALNPLLVEHLTGKKIIQISEKNYFDDHYFIVGSRLKRARRHTIIWGSGFISEDAHCYEAPKKIYAVRGPKSRKKLLEDGIECPEVYGDPALLVPMIYHPIVKKKYKLGIIPHYIDKNSQWLKTLEENSEIKIIDIQNENLLDFIDDVLSCEKIASSSLHGIIISDAYSIPSCWIELSDNVIGKGFKFLDYFSSVGRLDDRPLKVQNNTKISEILELFYDYNIDIDLNKLLDAAPFNIKIHPIMRDRQTL